MTLTAPGGKIPKDLSWAAGKKFMGNVDAFLKSLLNFDKDNIPVNCVDACEKEYISNPNFSPDNIRSKSSAAAGLCGWVVNICKYFRIYQVRHLLLHGSVSGSACFCFPIVWSLCFSQGKVSSTNVGCQPALVSQPCMA